MIPIATPSPIKRTPRKRHSFVCVHCHGVFLKRRSATGKRYCWDCEELKERAKNRAGRKVQQAIKAGQILPPTSFECWDCDQPAVVFDHRDYDRPLDVQPVCVSCNNKRGPAKFGGST